MTEEDARTWVAERWGKAAVEKLKAFATMVAAENQRQNLVSASSLAQVWNRHIVDSAQLVPLGEDLPGTWLDVGTGGGFPGIIVALLRLGPTILVEPRRRRAEFLSDAAATLGLNIEVVCGRVEGLRRHVAIISARAVASPANFFDLTRTVSDEATRYLLPSGRDAETALEEARKRWQGVFHVKQSITDPASKIIIAEGVQAR